MCQRARRERRAPLRQIEAAGEVVAVRVEHADAQLVVAIELGVGAAQRVPQREIERVALGGAIEADQQDVAAALDGDGSGGHAPDCHSGRPQWQVGATWPSEPVETYASLT